MTHIVNPTDESLQDLVEEELRAALGADAPHIGVATDRGTVVLTGPVSGDDVQLVALSATRGVQGVRAIVNELLVRNCRSAGETGTELAKLAQNAIQGALDISQEAVVAEVRGNVVTLTGTVSTLDVRIAAERAVLYLPGLRRVNNRLEVHSSE